MIVLLQEVKETNTSVFDGIRHASYLQAFRLHGLHDAYERRLIDGLASCRSGSKLGSCGCKSGGARQREQTFRWSS